MSHFADGGRTAPLHVPSRPLGRDAPPGDLQGPQKPGEWPAGGPICRRCGLLCSLEGHPNGCPRTPRDHGYMGMPIRPCYCGQTMVTIPEIFGACCEGTPPVQVPGGCPWCGSDLCRIGDPDDFPEKDYDVTVRYAEYKGTRGGWVHARCYDEWFFTLAPSGQRPNYEYIAERRRKRQAILGVIDAT